MKQFSILCVLLVMIFSANAQSVITVQHGATTTLYNTFDDAIANVQSGDYVYLPGGLVPRTNIDPHYYSISITKKISIFGAGYRADSSASTQPTTLNATISFDAGAEGSFITGVSFVGQPGITNTVSINCNNISLTRCRFDPLILNASDIDIEENVIANLTDASGFLSSSKNIIVRKNIIYQGLNGSAGTLFSNNIFIASQDGAYLFNGFLTNCNLSNNIIGYSSSQIFNPSGALTYSNYSFTNNLFSKDLAFYGNGNKVQSIDSIFTKYSVGSPWDLAQNFKLKAGCIGIKAGADGTDVGIYGTAAPFKSSAFPFNPHIQSVGIPSSTGLDGKLNINITVAAQNQ